MCRFGLLGIIQTVFTLYFLLSCAIPTCYLVSVNGVLGILLLVNMFMPLFFKIANDKLHCHIHNHLIAKLNCLLVAIHTQLLLVKLYLVCVCACTRVCVHVNMLSSVVQAYALFGTTFFSYGF